MPTQPPQQPKTQISQILTVAIQKLQAGVNFSSATLKKGVRVPELLIQGDSTVEPERYPLVGDRYLLGRSSRSCDIVVRNPIVSQVHVSLHRDSKNPNNFILKDEKSTNGVYLGKRRLETLPLRHGDVLTLAPPELSNAVRVEYHNPPPAWVKAIRYGLYGSGSLLGLLVLAIGSEWLKVPVRPLPTGVSGPVVIYARDGETALNPVHQETHRELKQLSNFSPYLPKAVIASEDSRYYWHFGVDPYGIARAIVVNFQDRDISQGASTLTQQLARSLFPQVGRENTAGRKLREMIVALKLEAFYSKDKLLETYLNKVYLGTGGYGFEDAAQFYFDKSARDLTLSEAATLVAMLPAPNRYNPVQDYQTAVSFRNRVIERMEKLGMVSTEEANRARRSRIEVSSQAKQALSSTLAPYFYSYVFQELQNLLGEEVAKEGNFIVETSLDKRIQAKAERSLKEGIDNDGSRWKYSQGALVTLDTRTGEILSLVGGADYNQTQFNRATQAQRQPGSTFKVFAYAAALEKGVPPSKVYSCQAFRWQGQVYKPCERSSGEIDMYRGLALSENVVALRVAQDAGLGNVINLAQRLGIKSSLNPVPGLVIGQSEVNLLEMTGAYATFANKGILNPPHSIKRILDGGDCKDPDNKQTCRVIYSFEDNTNANQQVIPANVAQTMTRLMQGTIQNGTGRLAYLGLGEAGKTGTTDDNADLWFIGYVPNRHLVTGIWLGNDKKTSTMGSSQQAAKLWGSYMRQVVGY